MRHSREGFESTTDIDAPLVNSSPNYAIHTKSVEERVNNNSGSSGEIDEKERKSTNFQAFMNTAKLFFGNAYLSIPNTFMFAGLIGGLLMFSLVGILNCYTMI